MIYHIVGNLWLIYGISNSSMNFDILVENIKVFSFILQEDLISSFYFEAQ